MGVLTISPPTKVIQNIEIDLVASKSISNRLLLIRALSELDFRIHNLSKAGDTVQLRSALKQLDHDSISSGEGGTSFRFLTALLALKGRRVTLEASGPMKKRPVGSLVESLRTLGAQIEYGGEIGIPPLIFKGGTITGGKIQINASESSQYISALMMIAPRLKGGLEIHLEGHITSQPYLQMTARLMEKMGVNVSMEWPVIKIKEQKYQPPDKGFTVESDWSGASYFWALSSLLGVEKTLLKGLEENSVQGDSIIAAWAKAQGFQISYTAEGLHLERSGSFQLNWTDQLDLNSNPDLAQTLFTLYACVARPLRITGLQTLFQKETDRLKAIKKELDLVDVPLQYDKNGNATLKTHPGLASESQVVFETYQDHRMAMSLSILASRQHLKLLDPDVVKKSFPNYWEEFSKYGFTIDPPLPMKAP